MSSIENDYLIIKDACKKMKLDAIEIYAICKSMSAKLGEDLTRST